MRCVCLSSRCFIDGLRWGRRAGPFKLIRAACTACTSNDRIRAEPMHKKNVVVVGAGFAGVSAARTLLAESLKPIDVTILEASTRVGGRACTREVCSSLGTCVLSTAEAALNCSPYTRHADPRLWKGRARSYLVSWDRGEPTV